MQGDATSKGLGYDHFHWFEVNAKTIENAYHYITKCNDILILN